MVPAAELHYSQQNHDGGDGGGGGGDGDGENRPFSSLVGLLRSALSDLLTSDDPSP